MNELVVGGSSLVEIVGGSALRSGRLVLAVARRLSYSYTAIFSMLPNFLDECVQIVF